MRRVGIKSFGGPDQLDELQLPVPDVGPEDVLIAVRAAGIGPWDVAQAAAVPVSEITAHQAICEDLDVRPHETVLINGAAGGTGVFAIAAGRSE